MSHYAAVWILAALPWVLPQDADPVEKLIADLGDEKVSVRDRPCLRRHPRTILPGRFGAMPRLGTGRAKSLCSN